MAKVDTSGVHIWLVLWKASSSVKAHALRSIDALQICQTDFSVLEVLLHKGPLPVSSIGKKVLLTSGSTTTAVDRLERRKLVERKWDARDRRVCQVHLTKTGRDLIANAFSNHTEMMEQAAAVLTKRERETLLTLLKKLGIHAENLLKDDRVPPLKEKPKRKNANP